MRCEGKLYAGFCNGRRFYHPPTFLSQVPSLVFPLLSLPFPSILFNHSRRFLPLPPLRLSSQRAWWSAVSSLAGPGGAKRILMHIVRKILWTRKAPACLLTAIYVYGKSRLCINIHHYAPPRTVLPQAAAMHAALHTLRRQYTAQYRENLIR